MNGTQNPKENQQWQAQGAPPPPSRQPQAAMPPPVTVAPARDPRAKSPALASVLSLVPGLGQVYVGYYQRGFIHAIVVAGIITLVSVNPEPPLLPFGPLFMGFFWLYNIIDAGRRASYYNQVLSGGVVPEVPDDFKMPGIRGSIGGGILLIAGGALLLSNTMFDVPLDWVADWWPVFPIALGVYLLYRGVADRSARVESVGD